MYHFLVLCVSEARTMTEEPANADDCPPSAISSSTVVRESEGPRADDRSSPAGYAHLLRRGSLDWTALEAAARKSSMSASAGCSDAAAGKVLHITETLGVVRHNAKPTR